MNNAQQCVPQAAEPRLYVATEHVLSNAMSELDFIINVSDYPDACKSAALAAMRAIGRIQNESAKRRLANAKSVRQQQKAGASLKSVDQKEAQEAAQNALAKAL